MFCFPIVITTETLFIILCSKKLLSYSTEVACFLSKELFGSLFSSISAK